MNIKKLLSTNEKLLFEGQFSMASLIIQAICVILFCISGTGWFGVTLGLICGLAFGLMYSHYQFVITDRRVISRFGIFSIHHRELSIEKIESVQIQQSFWARLWGYGTLAFGGSGLPQVNAYAIKNPYKVREILLDAQKRKGMI